MRGGGDQTVEPVLACFFGVTAGPKRATRRFWLRQRVVARGRAAVVAAAAAIVVSVEHGNMPSSLREQTHTQGPFRKWGQRGKRDERFHLNEPRH